jgi:hypothetical protein
MTGRNPHVSVADIPPGTAGAPLGADHLDAHSAIVAVLNRIDAQIAVFEAWRVDIEARLDALEAGGTP